LSVIDKQPSLLHLAKAVKSITFKALINSLVGHFLAVWAIVGKAGAYPNEALYDIAL
jgi:hypothetical protein